MDPAKQELQARRQKMLEKQRKLGDKLRAVCEEFILDDLPREQKQRMLQKELETLMIFYQDEQNWEEIS